jgi:hypothetical protein
MSHAMAHVIHRAVSLCVSPSQLGQGTRKASIEEVEVREEEHLCWPYLFNITHQRKDSTPFFDERAKYGISEKSCQARKKD